MSENADRERRNLNSEQRSEREFDVITLVLAGVLAAIILGAVGYGITNSSKVAATLPAPATSSITAHQTRTPQFTSGSGPATEKVPKGQ